jgi:hypothetical protein
MAGGQIKHQPEMFHLIFLPVQMITRATCKDFIGENDGYVPPA